MGRTAGWLELVAKQHKEWIRVVNSFGEYDYAEDVVQEAYIALYKYADETKIIKEGKVVRGYIFFTLRSIYYQYYNAKKKINKVSLDDEELKIQIPHNTQMDEQVAFNKICNMIDQELDGWHWYDAKLFKLYRDTDLSIRKIARETNISWVSIFNTLKNAKTIIRDKFGEDYLDYKHEDYDRI
jgi:RNA polymerase sigma factor (sigma-70 family)